MDNLKKKKLLVVGTGAVGGYYGGMMYKAGFDITFVARGKNYEALKKNGLTLIRDGNKEILPIKVVKAIHELPQQGKSDYIFICVKSTHTKEAINQIKSNVGPYTSVLSFQNGVDNEDIIGEVIGIDRVVGSSVYVTSRLIDPGVIDQFGYNAVVIGEIDRAERARINELKNIFESSDILCNISKDIMADLWNKLVWNASFNPVSVLSGKTIDKIMEDKYLYELVKNIMIEVKEVAIAHGISIRPDTVEFNLSRSKGIIKRNAAESQDFSGFKTSMLQDFEKGKPIELDELVGIVIKKAEEKNVLVKTVEKVYSEVKEKVISKV